MRKKRIGFGADAFAIHAAPPKTKKTRPAKRINQDVFDDPDRIIYFDSEEHLQILMEQ